MSKLNRAVNYLNIAIGGLQCKLYMNFFGFVVAEK